MRTKGMSIGLDTLGILNVDGTGNTGSIRPGQLQFNHTRTKRTEEDPGLASRLYELLEAIHPPWHKEASCNGDGPALYQPSPMSAPRPPTTDAYIATCRGCPVRDKCLIQGMEGKEWGIWGGTHDRQRTDMRSPVTMLKLKDDDFDGMVGVWRKYSAAERAEAIAS